MDDGLNPGTGSRILKISDFESGVAEVVYEMPDANVTGLLPVAKTGMLVGLWATKRQLAVVDVPSKSRRELPHTPLGVP